MLDFLTARPAVGGYGTGPRGGDGEVVPVSADFLQNVKRFSDGQRLY